MLVGARLVQGVGAAMMLPAALSILTTTFSTASDRHTALGAWGAMAGLSSAVGVFFGGVLTEGPGWRWVLLINIPVCVVVFFAAFRLVEDDRPDTPLKNFDSLGAVLGTAAMLLLVYALVKAPEDGWALPARSANSRQRASCSQRSSITNTGTATLSCRCPSSASAGWRPPTWPR
jgi:MFS family permease